MVMVRESSGCSIAALASVRTFWLPKPVRSQTTSYSGTSAKPNAKLPSAKPSSFSVRRLFSFVLSWRASGMRSGPAHRHRDERDVERERHQTEDDGGPAHLGTPRRDFLIREGLHQCCTPRATISRDGGGSQLWYGGGDDSSHSRPCAASQTRPSAFTPPFTYFQMMYGSSSCERPKPNAPS